VSTHEFTLVAAVNNRKTLQENLLASPDLADGSSVRLLVKEGLPSASLAYNQAIDEADTDVIVFVHQDIFLPAKWFDCLRRAIRDLEESNTPWGVLGSFGSSHDAFGGVGRVYTNGLGMHGNAITAPKAVETLDEIVLVLKKSSGLRFDPALPHFHMYGIDVCMAARHAGLGSFSIPAFCVHNTNQLLELPAEFYDCYDFVKAKWSQYLPIAASCMTISRRDVELRKKKRDEFIARLIRRGRKALKRVDDPRSLLPQEFWRRFESEPTVALGNRVSR
jgi:hypothetical protein